MSSSFSPESGQRQRPQQKMTASQSQLERNMRLVTVPASSERKLKAATLFTRKILGPTAVNPAKMSGDCMAPPSSTTYQDKQKAILGDCAGPIQGAGSIIQCSSGYCGCTPFWINAGPCSHSRVGSTAMGAFKLRLGLILLS